MRSPQPETLILSHWQGTNNQERSTPSGLTAETQSVGSRACQFCRVPSCHRQQSRPSAGTNVVAVTRPPLTRPSSHVLAGTHRRLPPLCPNRPQTFCYPSKLVALGHTHHATNVHPYPCPHCSKTFSFPSRLAAQSLCHDPPWHQATRHGHSPPSLLQTAPRPLTKDASCCFIKAASIRLTL